MNSDQLLQSVETFYNDALETMRKKNADYATPEDPFLNFRASQMVGVPPERAILVRMTDKLVRAANIIDSAPNVEDESILDTLEDLANYTAILRAYLSG